MLTVAIAAGLAGNPASRRPFAERKFALIDRDNFDEVMARIGPELNLTVPNLLAGGGDLPVTLRFTSVDGFEPLAVARQIPALTKLLDGEVPEAPAAPTPAPPAGPPPSDNILDEILAQTQDPSARKDSPFIRSAVEDALKGMKTYRKGDEGARRAAMTALTLQLREVMHAPAFQRLEANWRALHRLVLAADTGPELKLRVLDADRAEAPEAARRAFGGAEPYDLLVLGHDFGPKCATLLEGVAAAGGKVIAGASPRLVGVDSWPLWQDPSHDPQATGEWDEWRALRRHPGSATITLVGPRVMVRPPYGKGFREAEGLTDFEEGDRWPSGKAKPLPHGRYLWACASFVYAEAVLAGEDEIGRLPAHTYEDDGEMEMKCPTELRLDAAHAAMLRRLGLLGVAHTPRTDRARLVGSPSLAGG